MCIHAQFLQLGSTLCDPVDRCLPGSSVQRILQARILEWAAMPSFPIQGSLPNLFLIQVGDLELIPGSGRSPGEGNGSPLQYSCLENSMDRGAWQATVHGVAKSWTLLSN